MKCLRFQQLKMITMSLIWSKSAQSTSAIWQTANGSVDNKAEELDAGCDDQTVKPVHPTELLAWVRALLRRLKAVLPKVLNLAALELKFGVAGLN